MTHDPLTAPVYFIISGTEYNEGAIISRNRRGPADIWLLNFKSPIDWVIVETNYDHWVSPSPDSDKERRNTAYQRLNAIGQNGLTKENIVTDVLQIPHIFNKGTIYSTVMKAKIGENSDENGIESNEAYFKNYRYV